jgi:hypothetical protein
LSPSAAWIIQALGAQSSASRKAFQIVDQACVAQAGCGEVFNKRIVDYLKFNREFDKNGAPSKTIPTVW